MPERASLHVPCTPARRLALALAAVALVAAGCASALKPPGLQVERLAVKKVRLTGMGLEVKFHLRNPNPEPLDIDSFEYRLQLNGHKLGSGYHPQVQVASMGEAQFVSSFELNFLALPGTVKAILDSDEADVEVDGTFRVRRGGGRLEKLRVHQRATIPIERGERGRDAGPPG